MDQVPQTFPLHHPVICISDASGTPNITVEGQPLRLGDTLSGILFLDALRALLMLLGVALHTAQLYNPDTHGWW